MDRRNEGVSGTKSIETSTEAAKIDRIKASSSQSTNFPMTYVIKIPRARKIAVKLPKAPRTLGDEHSPI